MSLDPVTGIPAGAIDAYYDGGNMDTPIPPDGVDGECSCGAPGNWSEDFEAFLCGTCYRDACDDHEADRAYDGWRDG